MHITVSRRKKEEIGRKINEMSAQEQPSFVLDRIWGHRWHGIFIGVNWCIVILKLNHEQFVTVVFK